MRYCDKRRIYTHWGQTPLLLWETFGRFLFFGLKFEKSLYNLNMVVDIFTLSLNMYIYNEGKTGRTVLPNEIVMRQYAGGIYVKGHT